MIEEIEEQLGSIVPDCIIASVGGGGLMLGLIEGCIRNGWMNKNIKLIAVETHGADCFSESVKQNRLVTLDAITSIAKTLGAKTCSSKLFEYYNLYKDKIESIVLSGINTLKFKYITI
jgi:L-serine/L-threonine ammonia-lyase